MSALGDGVRLVAAGAPAFLRGRRRVVLAAWVAVAAAIGVLVGVLTAPGLDVPGPASGLVLASLSGAVALKIVLAVFSRRDRRRAGENWSVAPVQVSADELLAVRSGHGSMRQPEVAVDVVNGALDAEAGDVLEAEASDVADRAARFARYERRRLVPIVLAAPFVLAFLTAVVALVTMTIGDGSSWWTLLAPAYFAVTASVGLVADTRRLGRTRGLVDDSEPAYPVA